MIAALLEAFAPLATPSTLVAIVALGMAVAFLSTDPSSPTSRAIALGMAAEGISFGLGVPLYNGQSPVPPIAYGLAVVDAVSVAAFLEWLLRVRRTIPAEGLNTRFGDYVLRGGQACAGLYAILGLIFPKVRAEQFLGAMANSNALARPGFWLFATPILLAMLAGAVSGILLIRRGPDRTERLRVRAMMIAGPFQLAAFVLPTQIGAMSMVLGLLIFLLGAMHYLVLQGERGMFMSRFLSPQVAKLVRERGLKHAVQHRQMEISVISTDLRGFTAYAQAQPSSAVIKTLREYYDAVGEVVAEFGGTIKDYAGDGILILVGAPLPMPNHAHSAIEMARRIRAAGISVVDRRSTATHRLGIGIGVASGVVTVGIIGSASRWEYTAVGSAVNLACRLCEQARHGEILVDSRTAELAGGSGLEERKRLEVKGYDEPVPAFAVPA